MPKVLIVQKAFTSKPNRFSLNFVMLFVAMLILMSGCREQDVPVSDSQSIIKYHFDDLRLSVQQAKLTMDGGIVFVGSADFNADIVLLDEHGNLKWESKVGGEGRDDFRSVIQTKDGGFLAVGITNSESLGCHGSANDGLMAKFAADGSLLWHRAIGDEYQNAFYDVKELEGGEFIMTGYSNPVNLSTWLLKTSSTGDVLLERRYDIGDWHDMGRKIFNTPANRYLITGLCSKSSLSAEVSMWKGFYLDVETQFGAQPQIHKFDQYVREQIFQDPTLLGYDAILVSDGIVWVETLLNADFSSCIRFVKTDFSGSVEIEKNFYGLGAADVSSIAETSEGGYIICGRTMPVDFLPGNIMPQSKCMMLKLDKGGNEEWSSYVGNETSIQLALTASFTKDRWHIGALSYDKLGVKLMYFELDNAGKIQIIKN